MISRALVAISAAGVFAAAQAWALEPIRWNGSVNEIATHVRRGETVIQAPRAQRVSSPGNKQPSVTSVTPQKPSTRPLSAPPPVPRTESKAQPISAAVDHQKTQQARKPPAVMTEILPASAGLQKAPRSPTVASRKISARPPVRAKALYCLDCSTNKVVLAENVSQPMPIASITKLLTAMIVIDEMNLSSVLDVPKEIKDVPKHRVGIRPGDLFTVKDLLHGMLIESGNDCAEVLARAYPKGGRAGFMSSMNRKAARLGAGTVKVYTPSGLDEQFVIGRKDGRDLEVRRSNLATAQDVALIAKHAFRYPLIRQISSMKTYTMRTRNNTPRDYPLFTNDKLLERNLPVAGAKTGFTNQAGKCIVALFKSEDREHMVVVLNTAKHFKAAERIYRWAAQTF